MKHFSALTFLLVPFLFCSCGTSTQPIEYPINGQVTLEDSLGMPIPPPYSGIQVTLPGTGLTTNTDSRGYWTFPSAPQNNDFNIVITKSGFGSISYPGNVGTDTVGWWPPNFVVLTEAPDSIAHIERVLYFDSTSPWTPESISVFATSKASRVFIFIDTLPNVPSTGSHVSLPIEIYAHDQNAWGDEDGEELSFYGFHHGQTIYITACAASAATRYLISNNHEVLGNVGPASNAYPIVIP